VSDWDEAEDKIYDHQYEVIKQTYGKREADTANYGWGVTETKDGVLVETKVYGPHMKLVTDETLEDSWYGL
jgi:hypothetical protein